MKCLEAQKNFSEFVGRARSVFLTGAPATFDQAQPVKALQIKFSKIAGREGRFTPLSLGTSTDAKDSVTYTTFAEASQYYFVAGMFQDG